VFSATPAAFGRLIAFHAFMPAQPMYFALLQMGQLGSDQPHAATSTLLRVMVIALVVLLAAGIAWAVFLIWRSLAGKPRDGSHDGRTAAQ
jgi:hypothetical protein